MEEINVPRGVMEQLLQNAEDYALAMMETATPEQIENVRKQNELSGRGLEICPDCRPRITTRFGKLRILRAG